MTMQEAIALQPAWIGMWLRVLFLCAFILPATLVFWKPTRWAGLITPIASVASGLLTQKLYGALGYVKLLGLPHIVFWTPLIFFLIVVWRKPDLPMIPKVILSTVMGVILISLVFDYVDLVRYILGDRTPFEGTV
ncbi:MAG: hypothetical protein ABJN34_12065 [Litoreibacter sp.]|uniref:hypothetical protein n=1 Tax=Litoreibacter sp. TaxID=1969459 RepID=UPI0032988086